jgi:NADPH-dependent 2,4-dienoyl-CoA reductase/sulfur reductase-like enzyme
MRADVVVVGAGPAGVACALELGRAGADVVVVDEQPSAGGQIFRQPPPSFTLSRTPRGAAYGAGKALLAQAAGTNGIRWLHETSAWGIFDVGEDRIDVAVAGSDGVSCLTANQLVLAPGAYDLPVAFPGWTLPGVMAAGGVQAFVKSQQVLPGRRFVLAGAHPLLLIVADQLVDAGATLAAVALAQPRPAVRQALADLIHLRGDWSRFRDLGGTLARLWRAGVRVSFSTLPLAAEGTTAVERVRLARVDREWRPVDAGRFVECDTLALGFGFVPSSELARQAGCSHQWDAASGGWVIEHDEWMRTSVAPVLVAGEITGVAGAEQAIDEGTLAGLAALSALGRLDVAEAERRARPVRRQLVRRRRFSHLVRRRFEPRLDALAALATDETIVCRCENGTAGALRESLAANPHLGTLDAVKLMTRFGMGACQGRMCQPTVTHLVAAATGRSPERLGPYRSRPPVKPLPLAQLAAGHEGW